MFIDYKKYRDDLLPMLEKYGFTEKKDKTSVKNRVFTNGNETLIVPLKNDRYDYFYSHHNSNAFGDAVAFVSYMEFGHIKPKGQELDKIVSALGDSGVVEQRTHATLSQPTVKQPMDVQVTPLKSNEVPLHSKKVFLSRGLDAVIPQDFMSSFGTFNKVLPDGREFEQLGFLWRDSSGKCVGIQSKYLDADGACKKLFVKNSDKNNSLFVTSFTNKKYLLVCEDPFDALAHRRLYPEIANDTAYACTGGTMTINQKQFIYNLLEKSNCLLILGNDNDVAGQISNLKLIDEKDSYNISYDKLTEIVKVTDKSTNTLLLNGNLDNLKDFIAQTKTNCSKDSFLSIPQAKDWNDELKSLTTIQPIRSQQHTLKDFGFTRDDVENNRYLRPTKDGTHDVIVYNPTENTYHLYTKTHTLEYTTENNLMTCLKAEQKPVQSFLKKEATAKAAITQAAPTPAITNNQYKGL